MMSTGNKYSKVYVKESLTQVVDMSSYMTEDVQLEVYESKIAEPSKDRQLEKEEVRGDASKEEVSSRKSSNWSMPSEIEVDSKP